MSYEPTQPMRPPSSLSPGEGGGPEDGDGQGDAGQGDAGQGDAGQGDTARDAVAPASAAADTVSPAGAAATTVAPNSASTDTVPRGVLAQGRIPAPPGNAQRAPQAPQGGWGQDGAAQPSEPPSSAPQGNGPQGDGPQGDGPRGGWGQGAGPRGGWGQGAGPGGWNQGNAPQDYGQAGNRDQGNWNQGNAAAGYAPQGYPGQAGPQDYPPQGYGPPGNGPQSYGPQDGPPPKPRRRRRPVRKSVITFFILLVLAIVLVIANFVGKAIAENDMADQFTANGLPVRPSVNIEGFPFLTQVVQKDFKKVVISASDIPAGPVTISSLNATITGMHLNSSWNGATIDHLNATAFVSLSSLTDGISSELGDAASLTAVPDGVNKLKVTGTVLGLSASGEVEIKQTGPQQITIELPKTGGLVGTLLGSAPSFPINLPAGVPPSLRITGLTLNGQGLTLSAAATDATFSK
jgi:LmeA-like phospholipid-binding